MRNQLLYIIMAIALFAMTGCSTLTPTQKYETTVNAYELTVGTLVYAIDNDWIKGDETALVVDLEGVAYNRLKAMYAQLLVDPQSDITADIATVQQLIAAIKALIKPPPEQAIHMPERGTP